MKKRYLVLLLTLIVFVVALFPACRKINDYTEIGGGLIPPIDNINTFDTSLTVEIYNDTFRLQNDSLRLTSGDEHFLGLINNDPIFGKTDARIYFQPNPGVYGTYPFARKDSVIIDSAVLVLNYVEAYGDTDIVQSARVYEISHGNVFRSDSLYLVRKENFTYNTGLPLNSPFASSLFYPRNLKDSVKVFKDTTANQLRIKLDTNFARRMFNYDTTNAYRSDSAFKEYFNGFAVRCEGSGNAIMGFNLNSTNTKLAFYYHFPKVGGGGLDTAVTYFYNTSSSGTANYVKRDYGGTPVSLAAGLPAAAPIGYIQKSPGSYVNVKVPGLPLLSNRIVHRAEMIVEQLYSPSDVMFRPPANLMLDAYDPTITSSIPFRTIPLSLDISSLAGFNLFGFGTAPTDTIDASGNKVKIWRFDISRYVQHVLTRTQTSYQLRLHAPLILEGITKYAGTATDLAIPVNPATYVNPNIANGRVRIVGNTGPGDTNPHRIRLRIIYSKI
ncbi:MAG: DUF4270 family protein [Chitinophagaceae bacterium]